VHCRSVSRLVSPREGVSVHAPSIDIRNVEERVKGTEWIAPNGAITVQTPPRNPALNNRNSLIFGCPAVSLGRGV
jgi:hypothetical protein